MAIETSTFAVPPRTSSQLITTSSGSSDRCEDVSMYRSLLGCEDESLELLQKRRREKRPRAWWSMGLFQASKHRPRLVLGLVFLLAVALIALVVPVAVVYGHRARNPAKAQTQTQTQTQAWNLADIKSLVTFGDSYTDESRGLYFQGHGGQAPPPGWVAPITTQTAVGGYVWPRWVSWYSGTVLYNYAVGGAVCSTAVTPTGPATIGIEQYEVGAHGADLQAFNNSTSGRGFRSDQAVYAIWIGTNDLGRHGFIDHMQAAGKTLNDYIDSVFAQFDRLYQLGARKFVLMNNIPLYLAGMYATAENGGHEAGHDQYWPDKPSNITAVSAHMKELVTSANYAFHYKLPYEFSIAGRYPGANAALFDTHQLFLDMYNNPGQYFNGSAPANVTSSCLTFPTINQPPVRCSSPDSYIWYDELHPSEQSSRMVAKEFVNVLSGSSRYATYWR